MHITYTKNSITFNLSGIERVFSFWVSFQPGIRISRDDIKSVSWHENFSDWGPLTLRVPGTYLPYALMAGSYWTGGSHWDFIYAKKPRGFFIPTLHDVLVVETKLNHYSRIIVQVDEKDYQKIMKWWQEK